MDHTRDPCPWVILNDFGGAFAMGAIGGTVWHGIKGYRNSPYGERRIGAISAIKMRAPVLGGNFGGKHTTLRETFDLVDNANTIFSSLGRSFLVSELLYRYSKSRP